MRPLWARQVLGLLLLAFGGESQNEHTIEVFDAQCFSQGEAGQVDRSETTIRLLLQDWTSHRLVTTAAAFILKEWLGYRVETVQLPSLERSKEYAKLQDTLRAGVWEADLESWLLTQASGHQEEINKLVEPPQPIGFSGRSGLYILPHVLEKFKFADWWKFFEEPGYARSVGFNGPNQERLRELLGSSFPACNVQELPWCGTGELEGFWAPSQCVQNISSCIVAVMGEPTWDQGYFEQVVKNLNLPIVFAYLGNDGLLWRRIQLDETPEDVIFYSWSSNWGAEHFGGVRISFPDPSTVSVIADFERTPNGSLAVDYPDVSLVKLISRDLFEKAPEAYWMLSRLTIGPGRLLELLRSTQPTASHDALTQTACSFLKGHVHDLVQVVAPPCVTGVAGAAADVFDVTSGMCAAPSSIDNFKCFEDEQPSLYRSKTVIRLGQRDWLSHDLMRTITGMLLSEKLGYSVRYEDITSVVSKDWSGLLERNEVDAEMENWQVDVFDPAVQSYISGSGVISPPREIGWTGREGLFAMPGLVRDIPFADFYRFYDSAELPGSGFRIFNHTVTAAELNGTGVAPCEPGSTNFWCTGQIPGHYLPETCSRGGACAEAIMAFPTWTQGTFEQLIRNHNMSVAFSYAGSKQVSFLNELLERKVPTLFYGWTPSEVASSWGLQNNQGRVSFPDFFRGCAMQISMDPSGPRKCDIPPTIIYKLRRKDLADRASEAAYLIDHLRINQEQVELMLSMHQQGGGNLTTEEAACWFLKNQTEVVQRSVPECITNPPANPKIGDIVWSAVERDCVRLSCPRNASLIYDGTSGFIRCRVCSTENAGSVPSWDQMACTPCPAATMPDSLGEGCQDCPPGRYAQEAATASCQACPAGRYNPLSRQSRCAICPRGAVCTGGADALGATTFFAAEGFYLMGSESEVKKVFNMTMRTCADCWDRDDPLPSLGPFKCSAPSACVGNNTCIEGEQGPAMTGPMCGSCALGYQRSVPDQICSLCPPNWLTISVIFCVAFGGMLGLCLLSWSQDAGHGNLRGVYSIVLKILCNFFVQLKALGQVTDLDKVIKDLSSEGLSSALLTSPVALSLGIGDVLENPSTAIFSLECLMMESGTSAQDSHYAKVAGAGFLIPVALLFTLAAVGGCTWGWSLCCPRHHKGKRPLKWRILLSFSSLAVLEMYFMQPMVTSALLAVFNCHSSDAGENTLDTARWTYDMSIDCRATSHLQWQLASGVGLLLFSFGIPLILYLIPKMLLKRTKYTLQSREMWGVFGFLYDGFEPDFWYYESWMMLRKTYILIAANIFWLSPESRTVLLLTLVIYFRYMHLRDLPFDNRAYQGVDRLQFDSLATFTWLLLGRLFRTMLQRTENAIPLTYSPVFYIPAAFNFFVLLCRASYLVLREMIWPLQSPPTLLPECLRARLDHRVTFSFIPPEGLDGHQREHFLGTEHGSLSGLAGTVAEDWNLTSVAALPNQEREALKTIITETVEVLLRRHEIVHSEAPQVIYLPTFLLQMERVLVAAMCYAVKSRIINDELVQTRDTWGKWVSGIMTDTKGYLKDVILGREGHSSIMRTDSHRKWHDATGEHLAQATHLVRRPVSTEEIQIALYSLWPDLVDPITNRKHAERNHLRELVDAHKGIIDMHGQVSHIFDSAGHADNIVRRKTRSINVRRISEADEGDDGTSGLSSDGTHTVESWEQAKDILLGDSANLGDLLRDVGGPDECLGVAVRIPADIAHAGRNGVSKVPGMSLVTPLSPSSKVAL